MPSSKLILCQISFICLYRSETVTVYFYSYGPCACAPGIYNMCHIFADNYFGWALCLLCINVLDYCINCVQHEHTVKVTHAAPFYRQYNTIRTIIRTCQAYMYSTCMISLKYFITNTCNLYSYALNLKIHKLLVRYNNTCNLVLGAKIPNASVTACTTSSLPGIK